LLVNKDSMSNIKNYHLKRWQNHRSNLVDRIRESQQREFDSSENSEMSDDVESTNDEMEIDEMLQECQNCCRTGQVLHQIHLQSSPYKKKFCIMKNPNRHSAPRDFLLCQDCSTIFEETATDENTEEAVVWPAFVWDVLIDVDENVQRMMWRMIPLEWKGWWRQAVSRHISMESVLDDKAISRDVSDAREICRRTFSQSRLCNVSWSTFRDTLETYLCVPCVRCPYGCSEYLHRACAVPFDVVVQHYIQRNVKRYSSTKRKEIDFGFRNDLFDEPCRILEGGPAAKEDELENLFLCCPSIEMKNNLPYFLVCRFHRDLSKVQ